eukprot:621893-Amphidinium_carterae.1
MQEEAAMPSPIVSMLSLCSTAGHRYPNAKEEGWTWRFGHPRACTPAPDMRARYVHHTMMMMEVIDNRSFKSNKELNGNRTTSCQCQAL